MRVMSPVPDLRDMKLFDSCMTLGTIVHSNYLQSLTPENILAVLDRYCIAEALVHDHHARILYPREHGNRRLLEEIRGLPRLHPVWVLEPPPRPGQEAVRELVDQMLAAGVRAARLPMRVAPPMEWLWEDLCSVLEEHRIPCFLDFGNVSTQGSLTDDQVRGIREMALAHPNLPLILSHLMGGRGVHYAVVPLIRRLKNTYMDITGILNYWGDVARDVGPERVLFATGAPFVDPGILISNVQYARHLDARQKKMICGDNLRRLLGEVR